MRRNSLFTTILAPLLLVISMTALNIEVNGWLKAGRPIGPCVVQSKTGSDASNGSINSSCGKLFISHDILENGHFGLNDIYGSNASVKVDQATAEQAATGHSDINTAQVLDQLRQVNANYIFNTLKVGHSYNFTDTGINLPFFDQHASITGFTEVNH